MKTFQSFLLEWRCLRLGESQFGPWLIGRVFGSKATGDGRADADADADKQAQNVGWDREQSFRSAGGPLSVIEYP